MESETCRVCLLSRNCPMIISLYDTIAVEDLTNEIEISEILKYCCNIQVKPDDNKPQYICQVCFEDAKISYKFKRFCMDSDENLNTLLEDTCKQQQVVLVEKIVHGEELEELDMQAALNGPIRQCNDKKYNDIDEIPKNIKIGEETFVEGSNDEQNDYNQITMDFEASTSSANNVNNLSEIIKVVLTDDDGNDIVEETQEHQEEQDEAIDSLEDENLFCQEAMCSFSARTRADLKYHMIRHNFLKHRDGSNLGGDCPDCIQHYKYRETLVRHWIKFHYSGSDLFMCQQCDFYAETKQSLQGHISKEHGKFKCLQCSRVFNNQVLLKKHSLVHHKSKTAPETSQMLSYPCKICGARFKTLKSFQIHMEIHLRIKIKRSK